MTVKKIGVIGLGQMGLPMSANLIQAGYKVIGYRRGDSSDFVALGGGLAASAKDVAEQCDIVFSCIPDAVALEEIVCGPEGIIAVDCTGKILVELSTLATADKLRQAEALQRAGGRMLDGAISGLPAMVSAKSAVFFLSGDKGVFARIEDILPALSNKVFFMGEFGAALATKLCANMLVAINIAATAETIAFGRKAGIDPLMLVAALREGAGGSVQFSARAERMATGNWHKVMGSTATLAKDIDLIQAKGKEVDFHLSLLSAISGIYQDALEQGHGNHDVASIYAATARKAGLTVPFYHATALED